VWTVDTTLIDPWLDSLDDDSADQVLAALTILRDVGPSLGHPLVDSVKQSRHRNMKELRPGSRGRSELRALFAFDPARRAILLVAGDKAGGWSRWCRVNVPIADDLLDRHILKLRERKQKGARDAQDT
jgi:hypothetical protein